MRATICLFACFLFLADPIPCNAVSLETEARAGQGMPARKPKDLRRSLDQLDASLGADVKAEMKAIASREEMIERHYHVIGTWIRNEWLLWKRGKLQTYFKKRGVMQPEEMSRVILGNYYDRLHGVAEPWRTWEQQNPVIGKDRRGR